MMNETFELPNSTFNEVREEINIFLKYSLIVYEKK